MDKPKIPGGYYIKARQIQESEIAHAPPHVREIWDWLIKEANHKGAKKYGMAIKRGQCIRSYREIQDGLHWMVGWRKETYSKSDCETSMKFLRSRSMITTQKTTRGLLVTIVNYDHYQLPKNYETYTESETENHNLPQTADTFINKNDKNDKKKEKKERKEREYPDWLILKSWNEYKQHRKEIKSPLSELAETKAINKLKTFIDLGFDQVEVIDQSIENGWKGLFEVKNSKHKIADIKPTTYAQKQDAERRGRAAWLLKEMEDEKNSEGTDKAVSLLPGNEI